MKITLRNKKLKNDKSSLYIEFYKGSQKNKKGILRHDRTFEYLRLYLFEKPKNAEEKRKNKEALQLA